MTRKEFVARITAAATAAINQGSVISLPVVCAQAALESGWGNSGLAVRANNLFGIKAGPGWKGPTLDMLTREWSKSRGWYQTMARWRKYQSWADCVADYARIIATLRWYHDALAKVHDPDAFLRALLPQPGEPGWATDPDYFAKVRKCAREIEALGGPKWEPWRAGDRGDGDGRGDGDSDAGPGLGDLAGGPGPG